MDLKSATDLLTLAKDFFLSWPFPLAAWLAASGLLFAPQSFLATLGLDSLVTQYRGYLGAAWLFFAALLIVAAVRAVAQPAKKKVKELLWVAGRQKRLHRLTPQERQLLQRYIGGNTRTQNLNMEDGVVGGLEAEKMIYRASNISHAYTTFAYNIQPWAWDYLHKHPELLKGDGDDPEGPDKPSDTKTGRPRANVAPRGGGPIAPRRP